MFLRWLITFTLLLVVRASGSESALNASDPGDLLEDSIHDYSSGEGRWAYRQVLTEFDRKGRIKKVETTITDPSLPWDAREMLIATAEGPANEAEQKRFQRERLKEYRKAERGQDRRFRLRDRIDFSAVSLLYRSIEKIEMQLPILPDPLRDRGFPVDKIKMTAELATGTHDLSVIRARLLEPVRYRGVARMKEAELDIKFEPMGEAHHPVAVVLLEGTAAASLLFFPVGGSVRIERSEHRWVTPFDERFSVEVGTPTAIDF